MTIILGIESTAHTFGIGIVKNGKVLSNVKSGYTTEKGGIIPIDSAKHHDLIKYEIYQKALEDAKISEDKIDAIAFSQGPGLAPCLLVGMKFAKELSKKLKKDLIPVNHCIAHLEVGRTTGAKNPVMLYTSGANTQIIAYSSGKYRIFGETLDIGVGNFIDTFARYAGIGFPGGPVIQKLAEGKKKIFTKRKVVLLHGYGPRCGFDKMSLPWLNKKLEDKGYIVNAPDLPNRDAPKFNEWVEFLKRNISFNDNTILSAESFSGLVALRILENLDKPIKKLIMSGCFCEPIGKDRPYNNDLDWKFNFEKIKMNVKEIVILADKNDDTVPFERTKNLADNLGVNVKKVIANKPHFRGEKEPEKLKAIIGNDLSFNYIELPYKVKGMDIALSGILTNLKQKFESKKYSLSDLAYSLQETVFAMLVETAERALAHTGKKELLLGGGVACNSRLQEMCKIMCSERIEKTKFFVPERNLLVDNGAMIAFLGEIMFKKGIKVSYKNLDNIDIKPRQRTDEIDVKWK